MFDYNEAYKMAVARYDATAPVEQLKSEADHIMALAEADGQTMRELNYITLRREIWKKLFNKHLDNKIKVYAEMNKLLKKIKAWSFNDCNLVQLDYIYNLI